MKDEKEKKSSKWKEEEDEGEEFDLEHNDNKGGMEYELSFLLDQLLDLLSSHTHGKTNSLKQDNHFKGINGSFISLLNHSTGQRNNFWSFQ